MNWYKKATIQFPVDPKITLKKMYDKPKNYSTEEMKETLRELYPQWYEEENVANTSRQQIINVTQRYIKRWNEEQEETQLSYSTPSKRILTKDKYPWQDTLDILLESDMPRLTKRLQTLNVLKPYEQVSQISFQKRKTPMSLASGM